MSPIQISVVVPCFNCSEYLAETLQSIMVHRADIHEVIVVDDGSTDGSAEKARECSPEVRVIRHVNQGVSASRNAGLEAASGTHVFFMDADDLLSPRAIRELLYLAEDEPQALAIMGSSAFNDKGGEVLWTKTPPQTLFPSVVTGNPSIMGSWLAPIGCIRRLGGFRVNMNVFEDWEMLARVAFSGIPLRTTRHNGIFYRRRSTSCIRTATEGKRALGHAQVLASICHLSWKNTEVLNQFGDILFWSALTALNRGEKAGIAKECVAELRAEVINLAIRGPECIRKLKLARAIRLLGFRSATRLQSMVSSIREMLVGKQSVLASP